MVPIVEEAQGFPRHSLGAIEDNELEGAVLHHRSDHCILLSVTEEMRVHLYWACDADADLKPALQDHVEDNPNESTYVEFIPEVFVAELEAVGFVVHSEYIDYWLLGLKPVGKVLGMGVAGIREATVDDFDAISLITQRCKDQSRGFTVETPRSLMEWNRGAETRCRQEYHRLCHKLGMHERRDEKLPSLRCRKRRIDTAVRGFRLSPILRSRSDQHDLPWQRATVRRTHAAAWCRIVGRSCCQRVIVSE